MRWGSGWPLLSLVEGGCGGGWGHWGLPKRRVRVRIRRPYASSGHDRLWAFQSFRWQSRPQNLSGGGQTEHTHMRGHRSLPPGAGTHITGTGGWAGETPTTPSLLLGRNYMKHASWKSNPSIEYT